MSVHFLLSPAAKTINLVRVARMSKEEAETTFGAIRWSATDGKPVCRHCGCLNAYDCRRPNGAPRWRCKAKECARDFSLTSGTLFAFHKMPLKTYLFAILRCSDRPMSLAEVTQAVEEAAKFGPDATQGLRNRMQSNLLYLTKVRGSVIQRARAGRG